MVADLCHCMFVDMKDERVIAVTTTKWDLPNSSEPSFALDHIIIQQPGYSDMKRWAKEYRSP